MNSGLSGGRNPGPSANEAELLPASGIDHSSDEARLVSTVSFARAAGPKAPPAATGGDVGRYRLDVLIGRGGFGQVYRAFDARLGRFVAVKLLRSDRAWTPEQVERFFDEARKLAQLGHPGIVTVHDAGEDAGRYYLVAELVDGGTLADRPPGPVPWTRAAPLVADIADALHHAHRLGIVHRDIKPSNILLRGDGRPCLTDFGIAVTEVEQLEEEAGVVGSFGYMSPEQARGEGCWADARSDLYSLGVVLYELLTGRLPFVGRDAGEYRHQLLHRDPRPPRTIRDDIPPAIEEACLRCLRRSPSERFTTATDLAAALRGPLDVETQRKVSAATPRRTWPALVATATVLCAFAVWIATRSGGTGRDAVPVGARPVPEPSTPGVGHAAPVAPAVAPRNDPERPAADALAVSELRPKLEQRASWEISAFDNSVRLITDEHLLLTLGTWNEGSVDLSVVVSHRDGPGRLGLFWGYRPKGPGDAVVQFETIELKRNSDDQWCVSTSLRTMDLRNPSGVGNAIAGAVVLPNVDSERCRISVQLREGRLVRVVVDEQELPQLVARHYDIGPTRGRTSEGQFGLYAQNTSGRVSDVRIDDAPRRLTGASDR